MSVLPSTSSATRAVASLEPADAALIVWAGGTLAVLFYLFAGTVSVWRLRRKTSASRSVDDVHALAEALKIAQRIEAIDSETSPPPLVSGIWRPLIVLPPEVARVEPAVLEAHACVVALVDIA